MNPWLEWGIPVIIWFQGLGDWLIGPMKLFTFLGNEEFYLLLMPIVLWCVNARLGFHGGLIILTSSSLNSILKLAFGLPRPYWVSKQVQAFGGGTTFGLPSGHAQNAISIWGWLATQIRHRWGRISLGFVIFMISISRIFLGVHFPTDVLAGLAVGALLLWGLIKLEEQVQKRLKELRVGMKVLAAFAASLIVLVMGIAINFVTSERPVPQSWVDQAEVAYPQADSIDPRGQNDLTAIAGALFGFSAGGALLFSWRGFNASGSLEKRALRYLVGVIGIAALYYILKLIFPSGDTFLAQTLRYVRYAAVGFWASYLAPRLFVALRLA